MTLTWQTGGAWDVSKMQPGQEDKGVTWEQAFRCTGLIEGQRAQKARAPLQCPLKWGTRGLLKPEELWCVE